MGRKRHCAVCDDPGIATINSLIAAGVQRKAICEQFPGRFSIDQLSRHARHLAQPTTDSANDSEAAVWLERLHQAHQQAVVDGNLPAQISACTAAARTLEKIRKAEAEKRDAELPDNVNKWTEEQGAQFRHYIDSVVREATANAKPGDAIDDYAWLIALSTETRLLLRKVTGNPDLLAQTRELVAHQIPQCPITTGETNAPAN
jgi:hypothetical protein